MRVALISDIHGHLVALDAVLDDIERAGVDRIVCLGDIVDLGPQPGETVRRLRAMSCDAIGGNHDPLDDPGLAGPLAEVQHWTRERLTDDEYAWLCGLPFHLEVPLDDRATLLCVHGSPRHDEEGLSIDLSREALDEILDGVRSDVVVAGHTHVQMVRIHRGRTIANTGSVGMPFERLFDGGPPRIYPWAEYAIVEWVDGHARVDLRQVPYDFRAFAASVRDSEMPAPEFWLRHWVDPPG